MVLKLIGNGFVFQQNNDPKYSSKLCRSYLDHEETEGVLKKHGVALSEPES